MDRVVSDDPARALGAAERDGLMTYHGYMADGSFEVELARRVLVLAADEVPGFVARVRAVAALAASGVAVEVANPGEDGRVFTLELDGRRTVKVPGDQVVDWCAGYRAAAAAGELPEHTGEDRSEQLEELFLRPSRDDQCRMVILGLMHGRGEGERVSADKLAEMVGRSKKTVVDALGFGKFLASGLAEDMIRAFGMRWSMSGGGAEPLDESRAGEPLPQMPELVRLRRIVEASRAGYVRYLSDPAPNKARWLKTFHLAIGSTMHVVGKDEVLGWLAGVEAFHQRG